MKKYLKRLLEFNRSPVLRFFGMFKRKDEIVLNILFSTMTFMWKPIIEDVKTQVLNMSHLRERNKALSGEYLRHQVYAVLIDKYPNVEKRKLGLLIELAVNELI